MHINNVKINGFAAVKEYELEPEGNHVLVSGGNRRGKSSFLRAIFGVLTGKDLPDFPVNEESIKAEVVLGITGHTVTWTQRRSGSAKLTVERNDGQPITGGDRTYLTKLVGQIGEDPMDLVYMAPKDQKAKIQKILGLDFSDLEQAKPRLLATKKTAADQAAVLKGQIDRLGNISKIDPVDVGALLKAKEARDGLAEKGRALAEKARMANQAVDSTVDQIDGLKQQIESLQASLKAAEATLVERQAALNLANAEVDEARKEYLTLEDPTPAIAAASETNRKAEAWKAALRLQEDLSAAEQAGAKAEQDLKDLEDERVARLTKAEFPVEGLAFSDEGITYRGLPFNEKSQCTSDIIKVGLALQMVSNPGLKVVRISRGSELDAESRALVLQILSQYGFQGFIEQVTEGDLSAVTIEAIPEGEEA